VFLCVYLWLEMSSLRFPGAVRDAAVTVFDAVV